MREELISGERRALLRTGDDIIRLAQEQSHPMPFKQENLDLIRGNFVALAMINRDLVATMGAMIERIERLEAGRHTIGKAAQDAIAGDRARGM